ncbi:MAG: enhanced serine sensitivity protein SseB [Peptococcaceae bacterium]|jgi:hypothetical protein|nr:enhanced serine sensitivity protein SseB [Peptococcaceae bacterium]
MKEEIYVLPQGTTVQIGEPGNHGLPLMAALKDYLASILAVDSAYLLWMEQDGKGSYLLVLDCVTDVSQYFATIGKICQEVQAAAPLDIVGLHTAFGKTVVSGRQPFYTRQKQMPQ